MASTCDLLAFSMYLESSLIVYEISHGHFIKWISLPSPDLYIVCSSGVSSVPSFTGPKICPGATEG